MALREDFEKQGAWFFKWRSYLPFVCMPIVLLALRKSGYIERVYGDTVDLIWGFLCFGFSLIGFAIRILVAGYVPRGTSGRNTQSQVAETLNTTGMYSVVRNPLYLGNFFMVMGAVLFIQVWWLALIVTVGFWIYYERIVFTEEEFLRKKFGSLFLDWAEKTPFIVPRLKNWQKPSLPFALKTVLRREFSTFFSLVCTFTFLDFATNLCAKGKFGLRSSWAIVFAIGFLTYFTLLFLKKKTKVLNVSGR